MECITVDSTLITVDSTLYSADDMCVYTTRVGAIKVVVSKCVTGVYLRWWFNGWHYFNFTNGYDIQMKTESMGTQVTRFFSVISKIERPTRLKADYTYKITVEGIMPKDIGGFTGLIMAEKVEQYEDSVWREVDVTRGDYLIREEGSPGYVFNFTVTRKELPVTSAVFQKSLKLYIGDTLCDLDDDEVIPINKQTNNIAELQDRQSDFTAQFKIRKTRAMRALFELSGETGSNTDFPFRDKSCKLISDNIEIITNGEMILDRVDDQYYHVAIVSGNKNFFKTIEKLKLNDLTLASTDHTWNVATMVGTHTNDLDYVYPLCEPSDNGTIIPMSDDGDNIDMYGGWIWPFIKVKAIWDEIFSNAGYYCDGNILTNDMFLKLFMPFQSVKVLDVKKYLYSMYWFGYKNSPVNSMIGNVDFSGVTLINGDATFLSGYYVCPYNAKYTIKLETSALGLLPEYAVYKNCGGVVTYEGVMQGVNIGFALIEWTIQLTLNAGCTLRIIQLTNPTLMLSWTLSIVKIEDTKIGFNSDVVSRLYVPDLSQTEFIKMICNMFALVPDVNSRDHRIRFWNFDELYDNIPIARDWSKYLSERDDEMEFKFGDYAQDNYFRYADSEDVIKDNGMGTMQIDDDTLPDEKDVVELPVSTCDEVSILNNIFDVEVSRIKFNVYDADTSVYKQQESIDPRIVYISRTGEVASPPYIKTLGIRPTVAPGGETSIDSPKKASSLEVSFSYLVTNYGSLSRMLTKTNLRRAKFNLPVYEVAGLKHYIPIYLNQYKAYFYVNKINNYVPGKLTTIELIKL